MKELSSIEAIMLTVLSLPLLSAVLCILIRREYAWLSSIVSTALVLISAGLSIYLLLSEAGATHHFTTEWFKLGSISLSISLSLETLSYIMLPVVTLISFLVHLYSSGYMAGDKNLRRYFAMLGFFTFTMLGIVLSNDLLLIFIFWELVGFSSYMLIGHWVEKPEAGRAAQKAFLFNRIGDAGFIIGLMIVWANTQTFNISELLHHSGITGWQTAASLCIFCGVIGKSAQLPLFTWLPDAMEGPTPVSALIHAATMVAAGVYLLAKLFLIFTPISLAVVALVGISTALVAAWNALHQYDIKRILAFSTISQLGLMVTAIGVGAPAAAMFHLYTHAFFKAGLFLAAGSIIHTLQHAQLHTEEHVDVQDIRNLGGLQKKLPVTFATFLIAGSSLAGIPLLSGFLSKDAILAAIYQWHEDAWNLKGVVIVAAFTVSFITVLYTFRMIWFSFFGEQRVKLEVNESPWIMRAPLLILSVCSLWLIASWNPFLATGAITTFLEELPHSNLITGLSATWVLMAIFTGWWIFRKKVHPQSTRFQLTISPDRLYEKFIGKPIIRISAIVMFTDKRWIDGAIHVTAYSKVAMAHGIAWTDKVIVDGFVNMLAQLAALMGSFTRSFQRGKIQLYILWAFLALIIFLIFKLI